MLGHFNTCLVSFSLIIVYFLMVHILGHVKKTLSTVYDGNFYCEVETLETISLFTLVHHPITTNSGPELANLWLDWSDSFFKG